MGHVLFILLLILAFILQPVQIVLGIVLRFLWRPPALSKEMQDAAPGDADIKSLFDSACKNLDVQLLGGHWDAGKFLSMFAWATGNGLAWADVMAMADSAAKTLHRNPPEFWKPEEKTFSGDQLAGWMGAVADRIVRVGLTPEEKAKLAPVWENISFHGWPMLIPHFKGGKGFRLGFIWRPWQVWSAAGLVKLMSWLLIGRAVTGKRKCSLMFAAVYTLFFPALLLASPDGEVFVGKYYACSANASHSLMLDLSTGYMLQRPWVFKLMMRRLGKKRGMWSADWLALWSRYFGSLTNEQTARLRYLIQSTADKAPSPKSLLSATYYDMVHFEKHAGFAQILPPRDRYCDYTDERHLVVPENYWNKKLPASHTAVDVIFPAGIYLNKQATN